MRTRHRRIQKRNKKIRNFWRVVEAIYRIPPEQQPFMQLFEIKPEAMARARERLLAGRPTPIDPWPPFPPSPSTSDPRSPS